MVGFKGRSTMKHYLRSKPTKWGFKIWSLAEARTEYVSKFQVYTGKRENPSDVIMSMAHSLPVSTSPTCTSIISLHWCNCIGDLEAQTYIRMWHCAGQLGWTS